MAANRNYSSVARATTLTGSVTGSTTTFAVTETTGFPAVPFTMTIDPGRSTEEVITVTSQVGLSLTVLRGEDGTAAQPHDAGASLRHMATARDLREPQEHMASTNGVHGTVGDVVGTGDQQVLDNKTFTPILTDHTPVNFQVATGQTAPIVQFLDPLGASIGYIDTAARIHGGGIAATQPNTFTAGGPTVTPLTISGAASQTANLMSLRDSGNTEISFISPDGNYHARGVNSSHRSIFVQDDPTTVPLSIYTMAGGTNEALQIISSGSYDVAGISGETSRFQLYHGGGNGIASSMVPLKIHGGIVNATIANATTSIGGSIDLSSFGFDVPPLMTLTVRQENLSAVQRRVSVTIEGAPTTGSCAYRVHQSEGSTVPADTLYRVHWIAWQITPTSATG